MIQRPIISSVFIVVSLVLLPCQVANSSTGSSDKITINLSEGYVNGKIVGFVTTDVSDNHTAIDISHSLKHKVNFAPMLASIDHSQVQQGYDFLNGVKGNGSFGYQLPVASAMPGENGYSPLVQLNFVQWNQNANATVLKSTQQIEEARSLGLLQVIKTNIIINSPVVQQQSS
jgi:hypothetical protein